MEIKAFGDLCADSFRFRGVPRGSRRFLANRIETGYTLIELAAVVFLIGIILALGLPRVIPAIAFSELEGAARHLAGYGRALMAHCALTHEEVTFHVDLDTGEYWTTRWIYPEETIVSQGSLAGSGNLAAQNTVDEMAWRAEDMARRFERFARLAMQARSRSVAEDRLFETSEPLFEKEFDLEWDTSQSEEEIKTDFLARTRLPQGVRFKSVRIGVTSYTSGKAETTVTALGLSETVEFELTNDDEVYSIEWDAITGSARVTSGVLEELSP